MERCTEPRAAVKVTCSSARAAISDSNSSGSALSTDEAAPTKSTPSSLKNSPDHRISAGLPVVSHIVAASEEVEGLAR
ncbi:MAG: hypothetical protein JWM63_5547 [Gammaproteobacteria bacterium]|jgi:hypothetical protein|nr:hypothetical protein [Gammaproteobacteria bacterium]